MDTLECIMTRRSIRRFTEESIPEEVLEKLLEAVRWAPSWANTQAVEIIILKDKNAREKIVEFLSPNNPSAKGVVNAPIVAIICAKIGLAGYKDNKAVTNKGDWYMFDAGIASQNLCLAAHALGLGSVHVGYIDHQELDEYLDLPSGVKSVEVIPIGYPAKIGNAPPRRQINEFVHREKYGNC